jgi:anti-sigma regulatory factor (Ser/Thr protein kinase)
MAEPDPLANDNIRVIEHDATGAGLMVVGFVGQLTVRTATTVLTTLLKCFAEMPDAVIVDAGRMQVTSRGALEVFPTAVRLHAPPTVALVLCDLRVPPNMPVDAMHGVMQFANVPAALAAQMTFGATSRRYRTLVLPPVAAAPARARTLVGDCLRSWGMSRLLEPATLIVSELATNAVEHAQTDLVVTVSLPRQYLHIAVRDASTRLPVATPADHYGTDNADTSVPIRGRGLHLIDVYAAAWGSMPTADGKVVWATIRAWPLTGS